MSRVVMCSWRLVCFLWFTSLMVGSALGAEEAGKAAEQQSVFTPPQYDLGIWTIVVFVVLLLVLKKLAWGPMLEGLNKREHNIRSALDEAQKKHQDAQRLLEQYQKQLEQAGEKVRGILDEGRRHAQRLTEEMIGKARTEIQSERERLHREIDMARDQALHHLWSQTANLATLVSAKAIRRQLTAEDHRRLVEEALTELGQASNTG